MRSSELDYELPQELIAQHPLERRDSSRLLAHDRATGETRHRGFDDLPAELPEGTLVVVNDTRVLPARLRLERPGGGEAEVLLLEQLGENGTWEGLASPSRKLRPGQRLGPVELLEPLGEGRWRLRLEGQPAGEAPLPPYIHEPLADPERYQTVYAESEGSAAAPTAGLHFTPELLARFDTERVTLHVGLDTFRPLATEVVEEHTLHSERYEVAPEAWERIHRAERVLAVGTTTLRVLESLARGAHRPVRDARVRVPAGRRPADELSPAPLDAARARDGVRGRGGDSAALPARDRGAVSLLLVRRRDAAAVSEGALLG
jgi:S-adenosylmethionine:tRNA ribosyltransferase-isomerase